MFPLDNLVLAQDNALHIGHQTPVGNQVIQSVFGQIVLRQVQRDYAPEGEHHSRDHFVAQLISNELHRSHLCPSQELAYLQNHAIPQLSVRQV